MQLDELTTDERAASPFARYTFSIVLVTSISSASALLSGSYHQASRPAPMAALV